MVWTDDAREAHPFVGTSPGAADVRRQTTAADGAAGVLIRGERGVGKATVARLLHGPASGNLVEVDCAQTPEPTLPTAGTLLLREVAALTPTGQSAVATLPAGVRVLATTSHDGAISAELQRRLSAVTIAVPPLRERVADVPDLCRHFAAVAARRERRPYAEPEPAALDLLAGYRWPRNVRELRNFVDRAYSLAGGGNPLRTDLLEPWLRAAHVEADPVAATVEALAGQPLAEVEKRVILSTLQQFRGHRIKTAASLGIGVRTLGIKLKRWREAGEPVG